MVIVGAGASYDSLTTHSPDPKKPDAFRLPLADELFQYRTSFQPHIAALPTALSLAGVLRNRRNGQSLEEVLEEYATRAINDPQAKSQLVAVRYYIQRVVDACENAWYREANMSTNMHTLIEMIETRRNSKKNQDRPIFVTFNYDRLIESALALREPAIKSLDGYINKEQTNVFKLHGSVDWWRRVGEVSENIIYADQSVAAESIARNIDRYDVERPIEFRGSNFEAQKGNDLFIPAIAIPIKNKYSFECPEAHVTRLEEHLPLVTSILTIGWRGGEEHFLQMLRKTGVRRHLYVHCVTGRGEAGETVKQIQTAYPESRFTQFDQGFTNYLQTDLLNMLLNFTW